MGIVAEIHPIATYDVGHVDAYLTVVDADEVSIPIIVHENQAFHNILIAFALKQGCAVGRVLQKNAVFQCKLPKTLYPALGT